MAIIIPFRDFADRRKARTPAKAPKLALSWSLDEQGRPIRQWRPAAEAHGPSAA